MTNGPLISVVIPVFNREKYVGEAIDSVLAQTYDNWELILVDDGSTDNSVAITQSYAARFPNKIRCIHHPNHANRGISASRNLGGRDAQGSYIACLDSDDMWLPDKLERQVRILHQHPEVGLVLGATKYWHPEDSKRDKVVLAGGPRNCVVQPPYLFVAMYPIGSGTAPSMNTMLLRKDVFMRVDGWEEKFRTAYEDQAILCKIYLSEVVYISTETCDIYRQHAQSIMSTELVGLRYYRNRYLFLQWLESWFRSNRPDRTAELVLVQHAIQDTMLWPYRGPIRYFSWRVLNKIRRTARRFWISW